MLKVQNNKAGAAALIYAFQNSGLTPILDLDGCILNANHRIKLHDDGSLDLEHYRANTTAEQVAQDQTLPLIEFVQWLNTEQIPYHVATARVVCEHTTKLLSDKGIYPVSVVSRQGENDCRKDHDLKVSGLAGLFEPRELKSMVLIDDCLANCEAVVRSLGMRALHVIGSGVKA